MAERPYTIATLRSKFMGSWQYHALVKSKNTDPNMNLIYKLIYFADVWDTETTMSYFYFSKSA